MRGNVKIELTDIYSGEKITHNQYNLVTEAQQDLWGWLVNYFFRQHANDDVDVKEMLMAWFSSGIILLNDTITLSASDYFLGKECIKLTDSLIAWGNGNYSGSDDFRGTLNLTESEQVTPKNEISLIYDFPTNVANGTTDSLGIVPGIQIADLTAAPPVSNLNNDYLKASLMTIMDSSNRDAGGFFLYNDEKTDASQAGAIWKINTTTKVVTENYFNTALGNELQEENAFDYTALITDASLTICYDDADDLLYLVRWNDRIVYEISKTSAAIINTYDLSAIISATNADDKVKFCSINNGVIYYGDGVASDQRRIYKYDFLLSSGPTTIDLSLFLNKDISATTDVFFRVRNGQVEFKIFNLFSSAVDAWVRLNSSDTIEQILQLTDTWNLFYFDKGWITFAIDSTTIWIYSMPVFATKQNLVTPVTKTNTQTMKLTYTLTWT